MRIETGRAVIKGRLARTSTRARIAVLICVYAKDEAGWFRDSLESLFNQTYGLENINIYLGVNGPIGKDLEDVIEWAGSRIHTVIRSEKNLMLSGLLNKLIMVLGSEEYVARMDSDDICAPSRFQKQIKVLESRSDIDILGTDILEMDGSGKATGARKFYIDHRDILANMHKSTPVGHATICIRAVALRTLGYYDETVKTAEDIDLWFRALRKGLIFANLPETLYSQRFHGVTLTNRSYRKAAAEFKVYWTGCLSLYGYSHQLLFPLLRFLTRLIPAWLVGGLYRSGLRKILMRGS